MTNNNYFDWLMTRSLKALIYRNFFLYPRLKKTICFPAADIGCGIGDFLKFCGNKIIGYDINKKCIHYCKSKNLNAILMKTNQIPASNSHFNSVILDNVLEHIYDPIPLLNECNRVLDNKGKLLIGIPGEKGFSKDIDHKVNYSNKDLIRLIEGVGFKLEENFYTPFKSEFLNRNLSLYCRFFVFYKIKKTY